MSFSFAGAFSLEILSLGRNALARSAALFLTCPWLAWLRSVDFSRPMGTSVHEFLNNTKLPVRCGLHGQVQSYQRTLEDLHHSTLLVTNGSNVSFSPFVTCEQHRIEIAFAYMWVRQLETRCPLKQSRYRCNVIRFPVNVAGFY